MKPKYELPDEECELILSARVANIRGGAGDFAHGNRARALANSEHELHCVRLDIAQRESAAGSDSPLHPRPTLHRHHHSQATREDLYQRTGVIRPNKEN